MKKIFVILLIAGFVSSWCFAEVEKPAPQAETAKGQAPQAAAVTTKKAKALKAKGKAIKVKNVKKAEQIKK